MRGWLIAILVWQQIVLAYFAVLNLFYALSAYVGLRSVVVHAREVSQVALRDLLQRRAYKPVSILVPAFNEERTVVASVRSLLALQHPEFEVVVVSDGSTDATLERLREAFALTEVPHMYRRSLETQEVRGVYRSLRHPNLVVADKVNGGKADALNAAINLSSYPLVCSMDADSLLDAEALLRASRMFAEDERMIAVGGVVRPLNGAVVRDGVVDELRLPKRWIERFQVLDYARAFFTGRAAWSSFGSLLVISGAFGIFRRTAMLRIGGYVVGRVGEDMDVVVRMHRVFREAGEPYEIGFSPDPICWTEVPADLTTLRRQRNRWHRGLAENLWAQRRMLFNPRYGRVGMLAVPYFWIFELLAPVVEVLGYAMLVLSIVFNVFAWQFALLFTTLALLYGVLLSELAVGIETMLLARYPRVRDRIVLFGAAFLELLGYRQLIAIERFIALFQIRRKRGAWGQMRRRGVEPVDVVEDGAETAPTHQPAS